MAKVGVVLSGCGVFDGSEIYESTFTLLALDKAGAEVQCFAPDVEQLHVIDHRTGEVMEGEKRNVLTEAARVARGEIQPLSDASVEDFDAVILPGGFGAAKNLCTFAVDGPECSVNPEVAAFLSKARELGKPIGLICIAPAIGAKLFGGDGVELTIGQDPDTAKALQAMGCSHVNCAVHEIHYDEKNKVVSTPAYMLGPRMSDVQTGIDKLVQRVLSLA